MADLRPLGLVPMRHVPAYHEQLERAGLDVGVIECPFWSPRGEFRLADPDGYCLMISDQGFPQPIHSVSTGFVRPALSVAA